MKSSEGTLSDLLEEALGPNARQLTGETSLAAAGLDDIARYLLLKGLEDRYGPIPSGLVESWSSVSDIAWYVDRRELD